MGRVGSIQPCPLRSFAGLVQKRLEATLRVCRKTGNAPYAGLPS